MIAAWALWAACVHTVVVPSAAAPPADAPRWPAAPDVARVVWVGALAWPELVRPLDVSCAAGRLAVADPDGGAVWIVDLGGGRARAARGPGAPRSPVGVAVDERGGVWVADGDQVTVRAAGARRWRPLTARFGRATAVVPGDDPIVVDAAGHQLWRVRGGQASAWGPGRGELGAGWNFPVDAAADGSGGVWVVDALHGAVQRLGPDGGAPAFVAGGLGEGGAAMVRPKGVAVDAWGRLHVVDAGMQHVQVYGTDGVLIGRYAGPGDGPGQLALPSGLCIDGRTVYVADALHGEVQVYALLEEAP